MSLPSYISFTTPYGTRVFSISLLFLVSTLVKWLFLKQYMMSMVQQHKKKTKIVYTAYIKGRFVVQIIIKNKL